MKENLATEWTPALRVDHHWILLILLLDLFYLYSPLGGEKCHHSPACSPTCIPLPEMNGLAVCDRGVKDAADSRVNHSELSRTSREAVSRAKRTRFRELGAMVPNAYHRCSRGHRSSFVGLAPEPAICKAGNFVALSMSVPFSSEPILFRKLLLLKKNASCVERLPSCLKAGILLGRQCTPSRWNGLLGQIE